MSIHDPFATIPQMAGEVGRTLAVEQQRRELESAPHSRACGIVRHHHGSDCHSNCPTCGGRRVDLTEPEDDLTPGLSANPSTRGREFEALAEAKRSARRLGMGVSVTQNRITGAWGCGVDPNVPAGQIVTTIREAI